MRPLHERLILWATHRNQGVHRRRQWKWDLSLDLFEGPNFGQVRASLGPVTGYGLTTNEAINQLADGLIEEGWPDDRGENPTAPTSRLRVVNTDDDDGGGPFDPDWTIRPGKTLEDLIEERGLTPQRLAEMCDVPVPVVESVLRGEPLTDDFAAALATGTDTSESFWRNLERNYREDLAAGKTDTSGT